MRPPILKTSHRKPPKKKRNKHIGSSFDAFAREEGITRVPPPKKKRSR